MTLYMVVAKSYIGSYGFNKYCLGVFTKRSVADEVATRYQHMISNTIKNFDNTSYSKTSPSANIIEFELDKEYPLEVRASYEEDISQHIDYLKDGLIIESYIE